MKSLLKINQMNVEGEYQIFGTEDQINMFTRSGCFNMSDEDDSTLYNKINKILDFLDEFNDVGYVTFRCEQLDEFITIESNSEHVLYTEYLGDILVSGGDRNEFIYMVSKYIKSGLKMEMNGNQINMK